MGTPILTSYSPPSGEADKRPDPKFGYRNTQLGNQKGKIESLRINRAPVHSEQDLIIATRIVLHVGTKVFDP